MLPEQEGAIAAVEAQIRAGARAQQIFDRIKGLPRDPQQHLRVSVIGFVEEYDAPESWKMEWPGAKHFKTTKTTSFTTMDTSHPVFAIAGVLVRSVDQILGADEESLGRVVQIVSTIDTDGVEPVVGDILVENRVGAFWGYSPAIRVIKPDLDEAELANALNFVTCSKVPHSTTVISDAPDDPLGDNIWEGFQYIDNTGKSFQP